MASDWKLVRIIGSVIGVPAFVWAIFLFGWKGAVCIALLMFADNLNHAERGGIA